MDAVSLLRGARRWTSELAILSNYGTVVLHVSEPSSVEALVPQLAVEALDYAFWVR